MNDPELNRMIFLPETSRLAKKIYDFFDNNSNLVTSVGGMASAITGLDRAKYYTVAAGKGFRLSKYESLLDLYERMMLKAYSSK